MNRLFTKAILKFARTFHLDRGIPDELYLKLMFKEQMGLDLDFNNPTTFNEKLQWLKLYNHNPLYTTLVDKYRVKQWVAGRIGEQYVTPTYAVWERAEDIDISDLPKRFVLKTNHDSGGVAICHDKATFDLESARKKLGGSLRRNYYWQCREWPYKDVSPLIFAEEYLDPSENEELASRKPLCFRDGRLISSVSEDELFQSGVKKLFVNDEWRPLPLSNEGRPVNSSVELSERFDRMRELTDKLAERLPLCCIDFYESSCGFLFCEMTPPANGEFECFNPASIDVDWGEWIDLTGVNGGGWLLASDNACLSLCERQFETSQRGLADYKFMCFGGKADCLMLCTERETGNPKFLFFDKNWRLMRYNTRSLSLPVDYSVEPPSMLEEMFDLAESLSFGIPFVRTDLYCVGSRIQFGEMTFFPQSGYDVNILPDADLRWGGMLDLSQIK